MVQLFRFERCGFNRAGKSISRLSGCSNWKGIRNDNDSDWDFESLGWQPYHPGISPAVAVAATTSAHALVHAQIQHQDASLLLSLAYCMAGQASAGVNIVHRLIHLLQGDGLTHHMEDNHIEFWLSLSYYYLAVCQQQQGRGTLEVDVQERSESACSSLRLSLRLGSEMKDAEARHLQTVKKLLSEIC